MNEKEIKLFKADLKSEIIKELTGKDFRSTQDTASKPLSNLYQKYRGPLYQKYGVGRWAQVWDCVRKLATFKAGHRYVRDLLPSEEEQVADFVEDILNQMLEGDQDE